MASAEGVIVADDRLAGWQGKQVEDFYDLIGEELVREKELDADVVDRLGDETVSVSDLVEESKNWRFGHVIVDEAQDLTPMQWRMIKRRTTGGAITIVGDVAQRRKGLENWDTLVSHVYPDYHHYELTINYRSPQNVQDIADRISNRMGLEAQTTSIRSGDGPVNWIETKDIAKVAQVVSNCLSSAAESDRCVVIVEEELVDGAWVTELKEIEAETPNLSVLTSLQSKGLEFDHVLVISGDQLAAENRLSDLFVAVTRATKTLAVTYENTVPSWLLS